MQMKSAVKHGNHKTCAQLESTIKYGNYLYHLVGRLGFRSKVSASYSTEVVGCAGGAGGGGSAPSPEKNI